MEQLQTLLEQYFGYSSFRGGQEALVRAILAGRDTFGIMPTGGGKSICYQLPALVKPGITLVVSPLISLMIDQVMALKEQGIPAAYVNSTLNPRQLDLVHYNIGIGKYKILYIAPERLTSERFLALAQGLPIDLVAVDEAHCISQWGQDFRPSYLKIADFIAALPHRPVVAAFTATATEAVRTDIVQRLRLRDPLQIVTGFDRPNLYFGVEKPDDRSQKLLELVLARHDRSGIVYCATRKEVENVCDLLCSAGLSATRYHAGLSEEERRDNQEAFLYDRRSVMVATNAFGMGIDKSNVSYVIHYNMPKSLESYYQEAGRAGRDGSRADCILLFSPTDVRTARFLIDNSEAREELSPEDRQLILRQDYARLDTMAGYCKTNACLRGYILDYFGQEHADRCGNCGSCRLCPVSRDITDLSRKIFDCVLEVRSALGYSLGAAAIAGILLGSRSKRLQLPELNSLTVRGSLAGLPRAELRKLLEQLEARGYLRTDIRHGGLEITPKGMAARASGAAVTVLVHQAPAEHPLSPPAAPAGSEETSELYEALRSLRGRLAQQARVPSYVIFSNATLQDMARKKPLTREAFLSVSGVGTVKAEKYGRLFLAEIRRRTGRQE